MPDLIWPRPELRVCFDNGTTEQRQWVQDAVHQTWGRASAMQFFGWSGCLGTGQEVHVSFSDGLQIDNLGVQLNYMSPGLVLGTPNGTELDIRMQAVYGFGFVLGFTAEQDRGDAPASCQTLRRFPGYAQRWLGPWDAKSVMNDCNVLKYNGGLLSDGDIAGVQQLYGPPQGYCFCKVN